jgi:hypothetical protein
MRDTFGPFEPGKTKMMAVSVDDSGAQKPANWGARA